MSEEIKNEDEAIEKEQPLEVTIKKEEEKPEPSFDYDDYLPTEKEILETEDELNELAEKRKVKNA